MSTIGEEITVLARAHALFADQPPVPGIPVPDGGGHGPSDRSAGAQSLAYRQAAALRRAEAAEAHRVDTELARIVLDAHRDHRLAASETAAVLAAARSDIVALDNPVAARELLRRRALRLRAQHRHVLAARRRARRRRAALLALRYRAPSLRRGGRRAEAAVRAALSRLGCPYVWGATGPDRFDCSGLVKWAYAEAGVPLHRTTYEQINDGVPVPRSQVRPGDLVFPNLGHVQLAIGDNRVVEAPYPGAAVRISPLGADVVIRRPV